MSDLVERVVDAMLRARVSGGGVEHEAHVAIRLVLEEAARVADRHHPFSMTAAAIRAMMEKKND